jgi:hypothetical protein
MTYFTNIELQRLVGEYVRFQGCVQSVDRVSRRWVHLDNGKNISHDQYQSSHREFIEFYNQRLEQVQREQLSNDAYTSRHQRDRDLDLSPARIIRSL